MVKLKITVIPHREIIVQSDNHEEWLNVVFQAGFFIHEETPVKSVAIPAHQIMLVDIYHEANAVPTPAKDSPAKVAGGKPRGRRKSPNRKSD